jgi:hypothetical protein
VLLTMKEVNSLRVVQGYMDGKIDIEEASRILKRRKYRRRRERREAFGMMLQIDASPHDWLEGRGPWLTLVGSIDDATGHVWGRFEEAETTWGYLDLMEEIFHTHRLPLSFT